jgi:hypothetical protein
MPVEVKLKAFETPKVAVMVLESKLTDRVLVPPEENCVAVTLYPPVANCPIAAVTDEVEVSALPSVQPPPDPVKPICGSVTPLVVTVLPVVVELNVSAPVELHTVPAINDIEPRTSSVGDVPVANVTVPADTVISRQAKAPVMVTV